MKAGDIVSVLHLCRDHVAVRAADGAVYGGTRLREGQAMVGHGRVVTMQVQGAHACVLDVCTVKGPPRVNSDAYRSGWDQLWAARVDASSGVN